MKRYDIDNIRRGERGKDIGEREKDIGEEEASSNSVAYKKVGRALLYTIEY